MVEAPYCCFVGASTLESPVVVEELNALRVVSSCLHQERILTNHY